jgi:hypothetical protein
VRAHAPGTTILPPRASFLLVVRNRDKPLIGDLLHQVVTEVKGKIPTHREERMFTYSEGARDGSTMFSPSLCEADAQIAQMYELIQEFTTMLRERKCLTPVVQSYKWQGPL